jgi:hypothetical protein
MTTLAAVVGTTLVLVGVWDVFRTLGSRAARAA